MRKLVLKRVLELFGRELYVIVKGYIFKVFGYFFYLVIVDVNLVERFLRVFKLRFKDKK